MTAASGAARTAIMAKPVPTPVDGADWLATEKGANLPLSLFTSPEHGPRRTAAGRLIPHSLLGSAQDYEEAEAVFEAIRRVSRAPSPADSLRRDASQPADRAEPPTEPAESAPLQKASRDTPWLAETDEAMRQKLISNLRIFQKYRELRQERALNNWEHHQVQWAQLESRLAARLGTAPDTLLVARLGEYRQLVEERELVQEALDTIESRNLNFWQSALTLGNQLVGLSVTLPRGGPRDLTHVLAAPRATPRRPRDEYLDTVKTRHRDTLAGIDPLYGHLDSLEYMEAVGKNAMHIQRDACAVVTPEATRPVSGIPDDANVDTASTASLRDEFAERIGERYVKVRFSSGGLPAALESASAPTTRPSTATSAVRTRAPPVAPPPSLPVPIVLSATRLQFETSVNVVTSSVITVYNQGPMAVFFEWERVRQRPRFADSRAILQYRGPSRGTAEKVFLPAAGTAAGPPASRDRPDLGAFVPGRFFIRHRRGTVLPGQAYDFPIAFSSKTAGAFAETWKLSVVPRPAPAQSQSHTLRITLHGVVGPAQTELAVPCANLERELDRRETRRFMDNIINEILDKKVRSAKEMALPLKRKLASDDEDMFLERNREFHLHYSPEVFAQLRDAAASVHAQLAADGRSAPNLVPWDCAVMTIYQAAALVPNDAFRSAALAQLSQLVELATRADAAPQTSMPYVICYDVLVELAHTVSTLAESSRRQLGLPLVRPCTVKFAGGAAPQSGSLLNRAGSNAALAEPRASPVVPRRNAAGSGAAAAAKPAAAPAKGAAPSPKNDKQHGSGANLAAAGRPGGLIAAAAAARAGSGPMGRSNASPHGSTTLLAATTLSPELESALQRERKTRYTPERKRLEAVYRENFPLQVRAAVSEHLSRLSELLEDSGSL